MASYKDQIEVEKRKIEVFQQQIDKCKRRISSLEILMDDSGDELDTMASNMVAATVQNVERARYSDDVRTPKKRLGENTIKILKEIGKEGKELKELVVFSEKNNLGMDDQNLRNMAMIYRKHYGYIENPRKGFYRLTDAGQKAIADL